MNQSVPRVVKELLGQLKTLNMLKALVECESNLEDLSEEEREKETTAGGNTDMLLCTMHYAVHYALCS